MPGETENHCRFLPPLSSSETRAARETVSIVVQWHNYRGPGPSAVSNFYVYFVPRCRRSRSSWAQLRGREYSWRVHKFNSTPLGVNIPLRPPPREESLRHFHTAPQRPCKTTISTCISPASMPLNSNLDNSIRKRSLVTFERERSLWDTSHRYITVFTIPVTFSALRIPISGSVPGYQRFKCAFRI